MAENALGDALWQILKAEQGSRFEANIFSILRSSPYVVRSWEFALADGALMCGKGFDVKESYAQRFLRSQDEQEEMEKSGFILFDVKSSAEETAGAQTLFGSGAQRYLVAFYVYISAADPTFVELRPNYQQDAALLGNSDNLKHYIVHRDKTTTQRGLAVADKYDDRKLRTNRTKDAFWLPWAYSGLEPNGNPYRMPISLLNTAVERVRLCALTQGRSTYENPWTKVQFEGWHPLIVNVGARSCIRPIQASQHFTAYQAVAHIFERIKIADIIPDFVSLQPSLADFSLKIKDKSGEWRSYLVQHKIGRTRIGPDVYSAQYEIARGGPQGITPFFHAYDRFDYLWYEFEYRERRTHVVTRKFFFLPERVLPDSFYSGNERSVSFDLEDFKPYLIDMTEGCEWAWMVARILNEEMDEGPRKATERPHRSSGLGQTGEPVLTPGPAPSPTPARQSGRAEFAQAVTASARRFFSYITTILAERGRGLLVPLSNGDSFADLGYCAYRWSTAEQEAYRKRNKLPASAHHLPPNARLLAICLITQFASTSHRGPSVLPSTFQRLDRWRDGRLIVWDLAGAAAFRDFLPVVIPSEDFHATAEQRKLFQAKTDDHNEGSLPVLHALLSTRIPPAAYHVGVSGNLTTGQQQSWDDVVALFDAFLGDATVDHPSGCARNPVEYCHEMRDYNRYLFEEDRQADGSAALNAQSIASDVYMQDE